MSWKPEDGERVWYYVPQEEKWIIGTYYAAEPQSPQYECNALQAPYVADASGTRFWLNPSGMRKLDPLEMLAHVQPG